MYIYRIASGGILEPPYRRSTTVAIALRKVKPKAPRKRRSSTFNRVYDKLTINIPTTPSRVRLRLVLSTSNPGRTSRPLAKKLTLKDPKLID